MFKPRKTSALLAAVFAVASLALAAQANPPLSARLPRDRTVVFLQADLARGLQEWDAHLQFVDPEAATRLRQEANAIWNLLAEYAAMHEFAPALLGHVADLEVSFVIMAMAEPKVTTQTYTTPKFDRETGQIVEGEVEEHTYTEQQEYVMSLVVRTPSAEVARDFMTHFKAFAEREMQKDPDGPELRQVEVDRGELYVMDDEFTSMGQFGEYLVMSSAEPVDLWAALTAPAEDNLTRASAYQRLSGHLGTAPQGLAMVNLGTLIRKFGQAREDAVAEAQQKVDAGEGADDFFGPQMQLAMAQQFLSIYHTVDRLLSLSQLEWMGATFRLATGERSAAQHFQMLLSHGRPISPLLESILSGAGRFTPPPAGHEDSMTVLARLDLKNVHDHVIEELQASQPAAVMMYEMQMQEMKNVAGYNVADLLDLFDGEILSSVRIVRKEVEEVRWGFDEDAGEFRRTTEKAEKVLPELIFLWGLRDPGQTRATLSALFARLGAQPDFNEMMAKRMFQDEDVYCVGMNVGDPDHYPDGTTSFAFAVAGRYLAFGSWERVTDTLRQFRAGRPEPDRLVLAAIQQHPDSNLLVVMPKAFQVAAQKAMEDEEGQAETLLDLLQRMQLPIELDDPEMDRRLKESLARFAKAWQGMAEKAIELSPEASVLSGTRRGDFYEILSDTELRK